MEVAGRYSHVHLVVLLYQVNLRVKLQRSYIRNVENCRRTLAQGKLQVLDRDSDAAFPLGNDGDLSALDLLLGDA